MKKQKRVSKEKQDLLEYLNDCLINYKLFKATHSERLDEKIDEIVEMLKQID